MARKKKIVTRRESDIRWTNHAHDHEILSNSVDTAKSASTKALDAALIDHHREHTVHEASHEREHQFTKEALDKADKTLETRLEGMNEFRAQLEKQAGAFLTREIFETFVKEQVAKTELALATNTDKYDTIVKAIVNKHESDVEALRAEIQGERDYRKTFEGSINTWKWIATFLGASGLAGVILMFATGKH